MREIPIPYFALFLIVMPLSLTGCRSKFSVEASNKSAAFEDHARFPTETLLIESDNVVLTIPKYSFEFPVEGSLSWEPKVERLSLETGSSTKPVHAVVRRIDGADLALSSATDAVTLTFKNISVEPSKLDGLNVTALTKWDAERGTFGDTQVLGKDRYTVEIQGNEAQMTLPLSEADGVYIVNGIRLLLPIFGSLALINDAEGGYINAAAKAASNLPVVESPTGSDFDSASYKIVQENTVCSAALVYVASRPSPMTADLTSDGRYKVCVRLANSTTNSESFGSSAVFELMTSSPVFVNAALGVDVADGQLDFAERAGQQPLIGAVNASLYGSLQYKTTLATTACTQGLTFNVLVPTNATNHMTTDETYRVCIRLIGLHGNPDSFGVSASFTLATAMPVFTSIALANEAATGTVNAASNPTNDLVAAPVGSLFDAATFGVVSAATLCDGNLTYAVSAKNNASGLSPGLAKVCVSLANNASGRVAYGQSPPFTYDITPPTVGGSGALSTSLVTSTTLTLSLSEASDNLSADGDLVYRIYVSSSNNISTPALAIANGWVFGTYNALTDAALTKLGSNTLYYINVVVTDLAGNAAAYTTTNTATGPLSYHWLGAQYGALKPFDSVGLLSSGAGDGMIRNAAAVAFWGGGDGEGIGSDYIFVAESSLRLAYGGRYKRILKFDTLGNFLGWIGAIGVQPTGGAVNCTTTTLGRVTPGWCLGGESGDGFYYEENGSDAVKIEDVVDIAVDQNGFLFVAANSGSRILKFNGDTGAYMGWIGTVGNYQPQGGAVNCTTTAANTNAFTPGWCLGGTPKIHSAMDGSFNYIRGIFADGTYIYVTDRSPAVKKYNAATGAFVGWVGKIGSLTPSLTGAAGCAAAAVGDFTPGWCLGGTATTGVNTDGSFNNDFYVGGLGGDAVAGTGYLYAPVAGAINRYDAATGNFRGWIGLINVVPPSGSVACTGTSVNDPTPEWCYGGAPNSDSNLRGGISIRTGKMTYSAGALYYTDGNKSVAKFDATTGANVGYIGRMVTVPSSCGPIAPYESAPGWCSGNGTVGEGSAGGQFLEAGGIVAGGGFFYVADFSHRVQKFNATSGAFVGQLGVSGTASGSWQANFATVAAPGRFDGALDRPLSLAIDGNNHLYIADFYDTSPSYSGRLNRFNVTTGAFEGWASAIDQVPSGGSLVCQVVIPYLPSPGWCLGGTSSRLYGSAQKGVVSEAEVVIDDTYIYTKSVRNPKVERFNLSSGAYAGWFGITGSGIAAGDPGCAIAASGTFVSGWCMTGTGQDHLGTGPGFRLNATGALALDASGSHIYAGDGAIVKKYSVDAQYVGWIGGINNAAGMSGTNCVIPQNGAMTPGWCLGGTDTSRAQDTGFLGVEALFVDRNNFLYVADGGQYSSNRIVKFDASTGAEIGWIGMIGVSPASGSCMGMTGYTTQWCRGGSPQNADTDGAFRHARGLFVDDLGYLYVSDVGNHRIQRFKAATGEFQGWMGRIATSPTSGAAGCSGAAVGTATPGWCYGGTSQAGSGAGMFNGPTGIYMDANRVMYVTEDGNHRVQRLLAP